MPYAYQYSAVWWALGTGVAFFAIFYIAVRSGWFRKATGDQVPTADTLPEPTDPVHHYPEDLAEAHGKVPVLLKVVIGSYLLFVVWYVYQFMTAMNGPMGVIDKFLTS